MKIVLVQSLVIVDSKLVHIKNEYLAKMYNVIYLLIKCAHGIYRKATLVIYKKITYVQNNFKKKVGK